MMSWLFGCRHANLSRIWTLRPVIRRARLGWPEVLGEKRTYQTCLLCAREIPVCWETFGEVESGAYKPEGEREGAVYE